MSGAPGVLFVERPCTGVVPMSTQGCRASACRIVTERDTGKPRGFGFIEFFDIPTAESAIRNLSGKDFKGRTIRCVAGGGLQGCWAAGAGRLLSGACM